MYVQALGRAGRDGEPASSTVYFNASDLSSKHMSDDMKDYCRLTTCRREFINKYFGAQHKIIEPLHKCCDNCAQDCDCGECDEVPMDTDDVTVNPANEIVISYAKPMLLNYFSLQNATVGGIMPEVKTGLSHQFAEHLAKYANVYCDRECIGHKYPHIDSLYLDNITLLLQTVMKDF